MLNRLSISALLDIFLPRHCLLCGAAGNSSSAMSLCAACAEDLPRLMPPLCLVCAAPIGSPAPVCGACLKSPPAFDATQAALRYSFPVDRLVQSLKFGHRLAIADLFAACLLVNVVASEGGVIVPVPLSRQRLRQRGFNQALEIARPLARALRLPLDEVGVVRVRETVPQSLLPWRARQGNVRHAFDCNQDFSGRPVFVVDDVMTSGATLDAVARVLKDRGATRVTNWVVARAVKPVT